MLSDRVSLKRSHTCRHYYAQSQLKNGCDLYMVSKLLGHSKVDTTKRYLQSMQDAFKIRRSCINNNRSIGSSQYSFFVILNIIKTINNS